MEDKAREYGQMNLTLPHDVVPLPSEGVFYKNKKKSVRVGYMTAFDENILLGAGDDMTLNLLRNKLYEPDIRIEDLLEGDVEAILIFLRNTAFGPEMVLNLTDPITRKPFQGTVTLDQMTIIKGQEPTDDGCFITTLPTSKVSVKLKPMTYGEIMQLQKRIDTYPAGRVVPKITWRLESQIREINGNTDRAEIAKFVEQMPISDSKYVRKFLEENEPRLDMKKVVTAPSGEKLTVNVGFGVDFFRPFF